jgi:hypothetical protein
MFVTLASWARATSYHTPHPLVFLQLSWSKCSLMYGALLLTLWKKYAYYISFIDDFSKFTWIYLLKKCSDVHQVFLNFQQYVERKFDRKIVTTQTNCGVSMKN